MASDTMRRGYSPPSPAMARELQKMLDRYPLSPERKAKFDRFVEKMRGGSRDDVAANTGSGGARKKG